MSAEKTLLAGIGSALTLAGSITKATNGPRMLLAKLGWDLPQGVDDIGLAGLDMARVGTHLTEWSELAGDPEASTADQALALAQLADAVIDVLGDLSDLRLQAPQDYLDRTRIKDEFLSRLLDLYLIQSAAVASPPVFDVAVLLGWFELQRHEADPTKFQVKHLRHVVHWDRVPKLFTDPTGLFRETYGWGTTTFDPDVLVIRVGAVLQHIAAEVKQRQLPAIPLARLHGGTVPEHRPQIQLFLPLLGSGGALRGETGISVFGLPPTTTGGVDGGIGLAPYAEGSATVRLPLSSSVSVGMSAKADLGGGLALVFRPGKDPVLHTDLNKAHSGIASAGADVKLDLTLAVPQGTSPITLLSVTGATVEASSIAVSVGAVVDNSRTDATVHLEIKGGKLTLKPEDLPFLGAVSTDGLVVEADADLSWSHHNGVTLDGRAELKTSKTIGRRIGPLTIDVLSIGLATNDGGVALTAGLSVSVKIGPVLLIVDQVGVQSAIRPGPGNLGSADLTIRPVPPSGIGLEVNAPGVTGGGFLRFDPQRGLYAGEVHLNLEGVLAVSALGLIATRLPDGSKGFSLLVVITAENFKPIPLGLGFKLTGIGGLLAVNRTFNEDVLREGIKNHTLDAVLFPANPGRDAMQLLSNLDRAFPIAKGHHLFGPMVEIEWGTPTLITIQLGIVLELGARLRLLVMGQVEAILPRRDHDLLRIKMDAVGILDFDQGTASLDAVLYESRLLKKFVLTGGMAMRLKWKGAPSFALAVGGLHHAFNPPANFPRLDRLAVNLSAGDNPRILCEAYFAITSNTVQFGARANLYASAHGFSIEGDIGFDVLIQLSPFHFLAEFHASIQLKRGSRNLFKVKLEGALEGPRPLRVRGKATFEIFWWDISIKFDKTLVEGERPPPPPAINVLNELRQALADPRNWEGALPTGARRVVTVRELKTPNEVTIHPLGKLGVKQKVVPLNLTRDIEKFGSATPSGPRRFTITSVTVGVGELEQEPTPLTLTPLTDFFAPAQFFEMSDDESIASPSFAEMEAGFMVGVDDFAFTNDDRAGRRVANDNDGNVVLGVLLEYDTILVDLESTLEGPPKPGYTLDRKRLLHQARFGAAGRSVLRRTGAAKYQNRARTSEVTVARPGFAIASTDDLSAPSIPGAAPAKAMNWIAAQQALRELHQQNPAEAKRRQVVPVYELARL